MDSKFTSLKVPSVSGEDILKLSDSDKAIIKAKLIEKIGDDRTCLSCGEDSFNLSNSIYTHTTFSIFENIHRFDKVRPYVVLSCKNCGHETNYSLSALGFRTKGLGGESLNKSDTPSSE